MPWFIGATEDRVLSLLCKTKSLLNVDIASENDTHTQTQQILKELIAQAAKSERCDIKQDNRIYNDLQTHTRFYFMSRLRAARTISRCKECSSQLAEHCGTQR